MEQQEIGEIGNYYGGLFITEHEGRFYWLIENWDSDFSDIEEWEEISESLYNELRKHKT